MLPAGRLERRRDRQGGERAQAEGQRGRRHHVDVTQERLEHAIEQRGHHWPGVERGHVTLELNADFLAVLKMPDVAKRFTELGLEIVGNSPEEFDAMIRSEIERWTKVARDANIKLDQ